MTFDQLRGLAFFGLGLALLSCASQDPAPRAQIEPAPRRMTRKPVRMPARDIVRRRGPPLVPEASVSPDCPYGAPTKSERYLAGVDGVRLFVAHARPARRSRGAVVLLHGAGSPSSSLWDLPGEHSLMRKLGCQGYESLSLDVRGFGGSTMPSRRNGTRPPVRAADAADDLAIAVAWLRSESGHSSVDVFAWSWGSVVAGIYAGRPGAPVRRLVLYGPVWDRAWRSRHVTTPRWRRVEREDLLRYFDARRESREVLEAHVDAMFRFAPKGVLRISDGPYMDIYGARPSWDPSKVRAPTLIIRGEADRASQEAPVLRLFSRLERSVSRRLIVLGNVGHFAFRTHRYAVLFETIVDYLALPDAAL